MYRNCKSGDFLIFFIVLVQSENPHHFNHVQSFGMLSSHVLIKPALDISCNPELVASLPQYCPLLVTYQNAAIKVSISTDIVHMDTDNARFCLSLFRDGRWHRLLTQRAGFQLSYRWILSRGEWPKMKYYDF